MNQVIHIISTDRKDVEPHEGLVQNALIEIGKGKILHVQHALMMDEIYTYFSTLIIWDDNE